MNDGDIYQASWEHQREAAGNVGTAIGTFQSKLGEINTETGKLLAVWKDSASQVAYLDRQKKWTEAVNEIIEVLGKFKASLDASAGISEQTEKENATRMAG